MRIETEKGYVVCKTKMVCGSEPDIGIYAVAALVNDLAAEGVGFPAAGSVSVQLILPVQMPNSNKYTIIKGIKKACRSCQIKLQGIQEERHAALSECMIIATGAVHAAGTGTWQNKRILPGQQIVMTKWAGLEGTLRIVDKKQEELKKRFTPFFLKQIEELRPEIFALTEIGAARDAGVSAVYQIGGGGILAALWRLSEETGLGMDISLKRIFIRQETIEICEHFCLNPYQLASGGSMLMITDNGETLTDILHKKHIEAAIIGSLTDNHDKIIRNGEDIRYIDRPAPDELNKLFMEENYAG